MSSQINRFAIYNDEELMQMICQGEVLAFDELYHRYSKRLMVYFVRMLNFDKSLAQDALQDLFLKIAEKPQSFNRQYSFKTWIFSMASNACKNYYRHQSVIQNHEADLKYEQKTTHNEFVALASQMDAKTFNYFLQETLNELSHEKKEAFLLKYQEEKSIAEIAAIQNCPEGSVKSRLFYTTKELEKKLKMFNPIQ